MIPKFTTRTLVFAVAAFAAVMAVLHYFTPRVATTIIVGTPVTVLAAACLAVGTEVRWGQTLCSVLGKSAGVRPCVRCWGSPLGSDLVFGVGEVRWGQTLCSVLGAGQVRER